MIGIFFTQWGLEEAAVNRLAVIDSVFHGTFQRLPSHSSRIEILQYRDLHSVISDGINCSVVFFVFRRRIPEVR